MIRTINDGKELKQAIIDFAKTRLSTKLLPVVLAIALPMSLCYFVISVLQIPETALLIIFFSILIFYTEILLKHDSFFYLIKLLRLTNNSLCHYYSIENDIGEKYFIIEFFLPAKDMIYNSFETRSQIGDIVIFLMPNLKYHKCLIECFAIPNPTLDLNNSKIYTELEKLVEQEISRVSSHLPIDIKDKGKEMSKAYLMLYCVENTIRLFIEEKTKLLTSPLFLSNSVKKKIADRKANEANNKYLSIRGNSDLFYLDFKELGDVIVNNPSLLSYFPNDLWVKVKIEELGNIRNLIAHNSFIGELETKIIAANYESILRQIEK